MAEEHTHVTHNENKEHEYTHDHEDGHNPHEHEDGNDAITEIWEEGDDDPVE